MPYLQKIIIKKKIKMKNLHKKVKLIKNYHIIIIFKIHKKKINMVKKE